MKLITKNSQIVSGMCVNLINKNSPDDRKDNVIVDRSFDDDYVRIEGVAVRIPEDPKSKYCWELVSYPPRRPVTWEWVKENIDQVPGLCVWVNDTKVCITSVGSDGILCSTFSTRFYKYDETRVKIYIEPPHPEVHDVPAPWEVKAELETRKLNGTAITETWFDEDKPAEEKKSLWWFHDGERAMLGVCWIAYSEAKVQYKSYDRIQPVTRPVHEGPEMDKWRSV